MNVQEPKFNNHCDQLKQVTQTVLSLEEISKNISPTQGKTFSQAWHAVFDFLQDGQFNLAELNTATGIIQKLAAAMNQVHSAQIKTKEFSLKEQEHIAKLQKQNLLPSDNSKGLTPETLSEVEQKLKLL